MRTDRSATVVAAFELAESFVLAAHFVGEGCEGGVLHDYLWAVAVPAGRIGLPEADRVFREAMQLQGVPFLRRWILWAGVRWGALVKPGGRAGWWPDSWRVLLVSAVALPIVLPAAFVILVTLAVLYVLELLTCLPLHVIGRWRRRRGQPAPPVNRPTMRWTLLGRGAPACA